MVERKAPPTSAKRRFTRFELYGAVALGALLLVLLALRWLLLT